MKSEKSNISGVALQHFWTLGVQAFLDFRGFDIRDF
jgi:hypothetical protein